MSVALGTLLSEHAVTASAPCRIDSGGTWDIKAMGLPLREIHPTTVNMALTLRTVVSLLPHEDGFIRISSEGFRKGENFREGKIHFDTPFGIFFAALSHFGYHGVHVHIRSGFPVKSSLGGSSTALVALLKALAKIPPFHGNRMSRADLLHLAYHLEDALAGGYCGIQDQAAAVYGGVNQWIWCFENRKTICERLPLLDRSGQDALSGRLLVAYSGQSHVSTRTNRKWIRDFLSGQTRTGWIEANRIVHLFATALKEQNWAEAAVLLKEEMNLRREITPEALIPVTERLIREAEESGCGARFAGAGAGGSVWAMGEREPIEKLRKIWGKTLGAVAEGKVLDCRIDPSGVD